MHSLGHRMVHHCPWHAGRLRVWLLVLGLLVVPDSLWADSVQEFAAKAALTFNFARYTDWAETALEDSPDILRVCVVGDESLVEAFQAISGRQVGARYIRVSVLARRDKPGDCDLIFIEGRDRVRIPLLLSSVRDKPVLTIGEIPDFIDYGGIIKLYRLDGKIRFEISLKAAKRANLVISSRLLRLAKVVE